MKKVYKNTIIALIILLAISIGLFIAVNKFLPGNQKEDIFVLGNTHIYKGQKLVPDYIANPMRLTLRASWLDSNQKVDSKIKSIVEKMIDDAEKDGACLVVSSGYRTPEKQLELYNTAKDKSLVAQPFESEHQTGLAVDFAACPINSEGQRDDSIERPELAFDFNTLPEYQWLKEHAKDYGFEESFTKDNKKITGFSAEPWHWKYIIK